MTLLVLTLLALSWMTLDLRAPSDVTGGPRRTALAVFAPVQEALLAVVRPVDAAVGWMADQRVLHARLEGLRDADVRARSVAAANDDLAAENDRLRRLLAMRARSAHRTVGARVLGTAPGDLGGGVLITAGTADGVAPDMAVVDARGLVGRVVETTPSHARVELTTSPSARYAVRLAVGQVPGRLRGSGAGRMRLELNDPRVTVLPGAAVVTRAFEGSSVPDGLPIGEVVHGAANDRHLEVRPLVPVASAQLVQVIVDAPAHPHAREWSGGSGAAAPLPAPPRVGER